MPRKPKVEIVYTGKALKISEKVKKLESDLKAAKEELKIAYKEQLKEEKLNAAKAKKEAKAAALKKEKGDKAKLIKFINESGKSAEEILSILQSE